MIKYLKSLFNKVVDMIIGLLVLSSFISLFVGAFYVERLIFGEPNSVDIYEEPYCYGGSVRYCD